MKTFEEVKADMLDRAKKTCACEEGYKMGMGAWNKADLLKAVTANWWWVLICSKMIDAAYLEENFTEEELIAARIYTRKEHRVSEIAFACGSATVEACGSAAVRAYDTATVEAYGSSTVEAYGSSTVKAYGSSTVEAYGSSTVKAYDNSTVEAYDNSYVEDYTGNIRHQSDFAIVKDYCKHKIYITRGAFEIIEIENK